MDAPLVVNLTADPTVATDAVEFLSRFYDPNALRVAYDDARWSFAEEVAELIRIAREGKDKDKLTALRTLRQLTEEVLKTSGHLTTLTATGQVEGARGRLTVQHHATQLAQNARMTAAQLLQNACAPQVEGGGPLKENENAPQENSDRSSADAPDGHGDQPPSPNLSRTPAGGPRGI